MAMARVASTHHSNARATSSLLCLRKRHFKVNLPSLVAAFAVDMHVPKVLLTPKQVSSQVALFINVNGFL